jgi:methylmalonyl-CoA mutase N-terminal domain/subunit
VNSFDEALDPPRAEAGHHRLRTEQIVAHESASPISPDALAAAAIETPTSEIERKANAQHRESTTRHRGGTRSAKSK